MKPLRIAHLFPELLNLYADKGNILTLRRRLEWRGIPCTVTPVQRTDALSLTDYHLVLLGGGSDREQALVAQHLQRWQADLSRAVASGLPLLAVCGGYQLLGDFYELQSGEKVKGLRLVDLETVAGSPRLIGNIVIDSADCGTIVGFENHAGRTRHRHAPLGHVLTGHGNNGEDGQEGLRHLNIFGTYIHGPLLPKNPRLADLILSKALEYADIRADLSPLEDEVEQAAHQAFCERRGGTRSPEAKS